MALIKGNSVKARPSFNHPDSTIHRRKYKADYRPKEKYSTTTKEVGGFILHEVQVASPQSLKEGKAQAQNSSRSHAPEPEQEDRFQAEQENLENVPVHQENENYESSVLNCPLEHSELLNRFVKRKRGRPRKLNPELSTDLMPIDESTFNAEIIAQLSPPPLQPDPTPIAWTPLQRMFQLNQALACVEHYRDELFWDRIFVEFFCPDGRFKLILGGGKCYDLPSFVAAKLFWIWSQCGLEKLSFSWDKIVESMNEDGSVQVDCPQARLCSYSASHSKHLVQEGVQLFVFAFTSKLRGFTFKIMNFLEFGPIKSSSLQFGFDNSILLFLEVASVMTSVLPDSNSWLTWFQSYCQQNSYVSSGSLSHIQQATVDDQALFSIDMPSFDNFDEISNFMTLNQPLDMESNPLSSGFDVVSAGAELKSSVETRPEPEEAVEPVAEPIVPELELIRPVAEPVVPELEPIRPVAEPVVPLLEPIRPVAEPVVEDSIVQEPEKSTVEAKPEEDEDDDFFENYM